MNLKSIKVIIKERWIFYLCGYLFGYMVQILTEGIHGWQSVFPIKIMGIASAIVLGNIFYNFPKKMPLLEAKSKALKYTIIALATFPIIELLRRLILTVFGFNIMPLIL